MPKPRTARGSSRFADRLAQDAAQLASGDQHVVGPLEAGVQPGGRPDAVGDGHADQQRQPAPLGHRTPGRDEHRARRWTCPGGPPSGGPAGRARRSGGRTGQHQPRRGAPSRAALQHAKGKLTARERIAALLDEGTFAEFDEFARHRSTAFGMQAKRPTPTASSPAWGTVDGRPVFVFSQDFTLFGGALGEVYGEKIVKVMDMALKTGAPLIGINDGGGARIQEGVVSLASTASIFRRNVLASGVIPQISVIMGPCAGGSCTPRP
jgi:hypothetical protein